MFFSTKLKKINNIKHSFFSRKGGVSRGVYQSLNCGLGSEDDKKNVLKNLKLVANNVGCKEEYLITLNQTHSNKVIYFEDEKSIKNKQSADAIVSKAKNVGFGILTADCAPILFYDPKNKIIGCAHAGWKGALNGIIKNTIRKFNELNTINTDLIAVVGPCIKKENYEVKEDLYEKFISQDKKNINFFKKINNYKYIFDLRGFINNELINLNIKEIENLNIDTFSEKELFYSCRRSGFNKEKDYGRCISVILMT